MVHGGSNGYAIETEIDNQREELEFLREVDRKAEARRDYLDGRTVRIGDTRAVRQAMANAGAPTPGWKRRKGKGSGKVPKASATWNATLIQEMQLPTDRKPPTLTEARRRYREKMEAAADQWAKRGFSVIPLHYGTKHGHAGFQVYGDRKPDLYEVASWRAKRRYGGLGFVVGPASSPDPDYEFVLLDLDDKEIADRWLERAGDISDCIVSPRPRGLHVYFLAKSSSLPLYHASNPEKPRMIVHLNRKDDGGSIGELRIRNVIGVAPPTLHGKATPDNPVWYREAVAGQPIPSEKVRRVENLAEFLGPEICEGTIACTEDALILKMLRGVPPISNAAEFATAFDRIREIGHETGKPGPKPTKPAKPTGTKSRPDNPPLLPFSLQKFSVLKKEDRAFSIARCVPRFVGEREDHSWELGRHLIGYGDAHIAQDAAINATNPKLLNEIATELWEATPPNLRKDKDVIREEIRRALEHAKSPVDRDGLAFFIDQAAMRTELPACARNGGYDACELTPNQYKILQLFHVLQEVALARGFENFYITQTAVGVMLGITQTPARDAMNYMEKGCGIFKRVFQGSRGKASEYRMRCTCDWSAFRKPEE